MVHIGQSLTRIASGRFLPLDCLSLLSRDSEVSEQKKLKTIVSLCPSCLSVPVPAWLTRREELASKIREGEERCF